MDRLRQYYKEVVIGVLVLTNLLVWVAVWQKTPSKILKVSFLDVGQGDAILIETPRHHQMLIDGGRNKKVISEIGKLLPFSDRTLDIVMSTHPDADHIGGLPEVVSRYKIGLYLEPGVESQNLIDDELNTRLDNKKIKRILARRGQIINFGDGVKLVILFPNQNVSQWETNDASIVAKLIYGDESFLFTGDSPIKAENILLGLNKNILNSDILKAGHHGSRTSTSLSYANAVSPALAIISAGKENTYGHPHQEVLNILNNVGAKILSTIEKGTITIETDGQTLESK